MGSIFGISDLPVSTIYTATRIGGGMDLPEPLLFVEKKAPKISSEVDKFVAQNPAKSNPVIKQRNGIGKLMSHFSKVLKK